MSIGKQANSAQSKKGVLPALTTDEQKCIVLSIICDMADNPENLGDYIQHVDFDVGALDQMQDFPAAWLGHYRLGQGTYDVDRATRDLLTWPPISGYIFDLMAEDAGV
jgi:hypothetical protein